MRLSKVIEQEQTDPKKEVEGIEVHYGEGFYMKIARAGNTAAKAKLIALRNSDPALSIMAAVDRVPEEDALRLMLEVESTCILVGWRGLQDENGQEIPYTPAKAKELLSMPDFRRKVQIFSETQELYRIHVTKLAAELMGKA